MRSQKALSHLTGSTQRTRLVPWGSVGSAHLVGGHMLDRWFRRRVGLGSDVRVLTGPFAGCSGQITAIGADGTFRVTIDDCCRPFVALRDLRVLKARSLSDKGAEAE